MSNNKQIEEYLKKAREAAKITDNINEGWSNYYKAIKEIAQVQEDINIGKKQLIEEQDKLNKLKAEELALNSANSNATAAEKAAKKAEVAAQADITNYLEDQLKSLEKQNQEYRKAVKNADRLTMSLNSGLKAMEKMPGLLKTGFGKLKEYGLFEMDKEIRLTSRSLGISSNKAEGFAKHLNTVSKTTSMMGIQTGDLAKMQASYSEEIGRSVVLSEQGLQGLARMSEGTGLGMEGAAAMAASMDDFNLSVSSSADYVEETVNLAAKMGVNSQKAVKNLQTNLKLAQKFVFKGGVKGITRMANEAARLKLDMDGIAGLAEKVFRPEGAVEMAAKLQTMGGEFAKLGNPMELMFKARNDMEGFAKDIAGATIEFVEFNKETGETVLKGGLAADRMREIANITGIGVEQLTKMAGAQKKIQEFGTLIPSVISGEEDRELIASLAKMEKGKAVITLENGKNIELNKLNKEELKNIKLEQETLAERAKQSKTFDEDLSNLVKTFKSTLLPIVRGLKGFGENFQGIVEDLETNGTFDKIGEFVGAFGSGIATLAKILGPKGTLATVLVGGLLSKAKWIINGVQLGLGFLKTTKGFGGGAGGGAGGWANGSGNTMGRGRNISKYGKVGGRIANVGRGIGAKGGLIGLGAGLAIDGVRNSGMVDEGSTADKGLGIAASALEYGGTGAMIGSLFGPIGTAVGGVIGGLGGAIYAAVENGAFDDMMGNVKKPQGNSVKPLDINDGVIKFNGNDKFMNVGDDTMIAGTNVNGNKKLASAMTSGGGSGNVKHKFEDLNIKISLSSDSSWLNKIGDEIVNDRTFIRGISVKIQEEIRMAIGGGKLNPNPS